MKLHEIITDWTKKQAVLDERIYTRFGISEGRDVLPQLLLAFKSELGEAANEFRGFKYWSQDREPRGAALLEELIDCIHFLLSIGNTTYALHLADDFGNRLFYPDLLISTTWQELRAEHEETYNKRMSEKFNSVFMAIVHFEDKQDYKQYLLTFQRLLDLTALLGFTLQEVVGAYDAKNAKNHDRQGAGY